MKTELTHEELADEFRRLSRDAGATPNGALTATDSADDFDDGFDPEVANDRGDSISIRFHGRFETLETLDVRAGSPDDAKGTSMELVGPDMPGLTTILARLETEAQETAARDLKSGSAGSGFWGVAWAAGWVGAAVGAPLAFLGVDAFANQHPAALAAIAAIAIAPALLILYTANAAREARRTNEQTRRLMVLAEQALTPSDPSLSRASSLGQSVRSEIVALQSVVEGALDRFAELEAAASRNALVLNDAVSNAATGTSALTQTLRNERAALEALTADLHGQTDLIGESVSRQVRLMRETSHLVRQEFMAADETFQNHFSSFTTSAALMAERTQAIETAANATQAATVRLDNTVLTALEALSQATSLTDSARQSADAATQAANATAGAIRDTTRRAVSDARRVAQLIRNETQALEESAATTLSRLKDAADEARQASDEAQAAADRHAESVQRRLTANAAMYAQAVVQKPITADHYAHDEGVAEYRRDSERAPRREAMRPAPVAAAPQFAATEELGHRFGLETPHVAPKSPVENALAILEQAGVNAATLFSTPDLDFIANRARQGGAARRQAVSAAAPDAVNRLQDLFDRSEVSRAFASAFRAKPELATQTGGKSLLVAYLLIDAALG